MSFLNSVILVVTLYRLNRVSKAPVTIRSHVFSHKESAKGKEKEKKEIYTVHKNFQTNTPPGGVIQTITTNTATVFKSISNNSKTGNSTEKSLIIKKSQKKTKPPKISITQQKISSTRVGVYKTIERTKSVGILGSRKQRTIIYLRLSTVIGSTWIIGIHNGPKWPKNWN